MLFLPYAIAVAVLATIGSRCSAKPTPAQLHNIITEILYEDEQWRDVLSERVRLNGDTVPPLARQDVLIAGHYVDTLVALHELMKSPEHVSGADLRLSAMILDTAVMCQAFKRVAVHVALTVRMVELEAEQREFVMRAMIFANVVPTYMNVLSTSGERYAQLSEVFDAVMPVARQTAEHVEKQKYVDRLSMALRSLTNTIGASCEQADMSDYFRTLRLPTVERLPTSIFDGNRVADSVDLVTVVQLLRENETAIMAVYDEMYLLKHMDMSTWKSVLNYPEMPDDVVKELEMITTTTTSPESYRDTMMKMDQTETREINIESDTDKPTPGVIRHRKKAKSDFN